MSELSCATCKWWNPWGGLESISAGECKRHAPWLDRRNGGGVWPQVNRNDWCGEHECREPDGLALVEHLRKEMGIKAEIRTAPDGRTAIWFGPGIQEDE